MAFVINTRSIITELGFSKSVNWNKCPISHCTSLFIYLCMRDEVSPHLDTKESLMESIRSIFISHGHFVNGSQSGCLSG